MKRLFLIALLLLPLAGFSETLLVSVPPHRYFVEKIAGSGFEVQLLLPPGASPHSYEPTARQILASSKAEIWFQVGEGFEEKVEAALRAYRPELVTVDLREGLDLIPYQEGESVHRCGHSHNCYDPHIWLSPRLAKQQAERIAGVLSQKYPEKKEQFSQNLSSFRKEMDALDHQIETTLAPLQNRSIMVSHPAYAYFARDYNLKQIPIEFEGKDPTPRQVTEILQSAKQQNIRTIFVQEQHSSKGARLIADQIGAKVVVLDPLKENYPENMRKIARSFAQ